MIIIIKYAIFFTAGALFFWPTESRLLKKNIVKYLELFVVFIDVNMQTIEIFANLCGIKKNLLCAAIII